MLTSFNINAIIDQAKTDDQDKKQIDTKKTVRTESNQSRVKGGEYTPFQADTIIISADGDEGTALSCLENMEVGEKTIIHCLFPDHEDKNPSSFLEKKKEGSLYAFCSSCGRKGYYNNNKQPSNNVTQIDVSIKAFSNVVIQKLTTLGSECNVECIIEQLLNCGIPIVSFAGYLYFWVDGVWRRHLDQDTEHKVFVKKAVLKIIGKRPSASLVKSVHKELLMECREFDQSKGTLINFKNKILSIEKNNFMLLDHNPDYGMKYQLGFDYDPSATCPTIDRFMKETIGDDKTISFLYQFIASAFIPKNTMKIEKALFLYGAGSNGKSVLLDLLRHLFGSENVSSVSLKHMSDAKERSRMVGKVINIASEGSANKFDTEDLKAIISKEMLSVKLLYANSTETDEFPILIFASNNMPDTGGDYSNGIMRRMAIVSCDKIVPPKKQDTALLSKLIAELPGLMNHVLRGATELMEAGQLYMPPKMKETVRKYELENDPVKYFFDEKKYVLDINVPYYDINILYSEFVDFCFHAGIKKIEKRKFSSRVSAIFGKQGHSNKIYGWKIRKSFAQ